MRGGFLPPALIAAALAFALAFAPRRAMAAGLAVFAAVAAAALLLPVAPRWEDAVFAACWATVAVTAAAVHLPGGTMPVVAVVLAANAGLWAGVVVATAGVPADLARAVPVALLAVPAAWLVAHRGGIAVKVVASWLIAVAILGAALPIVPTPGYSPDHME